MNDDRRLVYSTEQGALDKPVRSNPSQRPGKNTNQQAATASNIKNPAKQGIRIRRECKGRGGKTVSIIDGLPLQEKELKTLLKKLKGQLGTGGAIKNGTLEIQGDHREKLLLLLENLGHSAKLSGG